MAGLKIDQIQFQIIIDNDQARINLRNIDAEIQKLRKEMKKVPEGSAEWLKMKDRVQELTNAHEDAIDAIGLHGLSLKELAKRQKEINKLMDQMDPNSKEWEMLAKQSKEIGGRMTELRGGIVQTKSAFSMMKGGITELLPMLGLGAGLAGAFNFVKGAILSVQSTGDKFEMFMGGIAEVTNHLKQTLATLDFTKMITGLRSAFEEGKRYAEMLDLIGDLERSLQIERAGIDVEIAQLRLIARNRRLDLTEREDAVNKIVALEKKKMEASLEYENLRLDNELKSAAARTQATEQEIADFMKMNQIKATEIVNQGQKLKEELTKQATITVTSNNPGMPGYTATQFDQSAYNSAYQNLTDNQKEAIRLYEVQNNLTEEQRAKITQIMVAQQGAVQTMLAGEESLIRIKNSLYNELIKEENEEEKLAETTVRATEEKIDKTQEYYDQINRLEDEKWEQTLSANDRELLAIDKKYEALYALADESNQDITQLQLQHVAEIEAKQREQAQKASMQQFTDMQTQFNQNKIARETEYNNQLAALGNNEEAKKALTKRYKEENLKIELEYLTKLKELAELMTVDTSLLSDDKKAELLNKIKQLGLEISQIMVEISETGTDGEEGSSTLAKMLGMTDEEIQKLNEKVQLIGNAISETLNGINQMITNSENKQFQQFADSNEKKKKLLKQRLNAGILSQDQYNKQVTALDEELDKKKRKLEHDQAVRAKSMAIIQAMINVAQGITAALSQMPPASYIMAAITGALGAIQIAAIASQPVPSYARGKYDVKATDGNTYQAEYIQRSRTGIYNRPTLVGGLGLVGEKAPELVVDGPTLSNIQMNAPEIIQAIHAMRVPQYATGYYPERVSSVPSGTVGSSKNDSMTALLREISAKLDNPTRAKIVWSDWDDANTEITDIKNSVSK